MPGYLRKFLTSLLMPRNKLHLSRTVYVGMFKNALLGSHYFRVNKSRFGDAVAKRIYTLYSKYQRLLTSRYIKIHKNPRYRSNRTRPATFRQYDLIKSHRNSLPAVHLIQSCAHCTVPVSPRFEVPTFLYGLMPLQCILSCK